MKIFTRVCLYYIEAVYLYIWAFSSVLITLYITSPFIHEPLHAIVCKAYGFSPIIYRYSVTCEGIQNISLFANFLYRMMPYIGWSMFVVIVWKFHIRFKVLKYLLLIPISDVVVNYVNSLSVGTDFIYLGSVGNFYAAVILVTSFSMLSTNLIFKTRVWHFSVLKDDFNMDIEGKVKGWIE